MPPVAVFDTNVLFEGSFQEIAIVSAADFLAVSLLTYGEYVLLGKCFGLQ